jgi:hypothetical protein
MRARNIIPLFIIKEAVLLLPPVTLFGIYREGTQAKASASVRNAVKMYKFCRSGSGLLWITEPAQPQ